MGWCIPDEQTPALLDLLEKARSAELHVPPVWASEFSNVLGKAHQRGRLTDADVSSALELVANLNIRIAQGWDNITLAEALVMMHRYSLTSYDASYLARAIERKLPLATLDKDLRDAAIMAGVRLLI